jgi:hypothetical protein
MLKDIDKFGLEGLISNETMEKIVMLDYECFLEEE